MHKLFSFLNTLLTKLSLALIFIYQKTISPDEGVLKFALKGKVCAHEPHCSEYARLSLVRYGFLDSIEQIINRIISCRPSMTKNYDPVSYKVVFASSAPIGVPFLTALSSDPRFDVVGVITQPDQPSGRGLKLHENIIKTEAKKLPNKLGGSIDFNISENSQKALEYIISMLHDNQFDYSIAGGLAAKFYGSKRELADIDIDVHDYHLVKIMDLCAQYSKGIQLYQDDEREINILTLDYDGQIIELCGIETAKIYDYHTKQRTKYDDTLNYESVIHDGQHYHIKPVDELMSYKGKISRRVDIEDVGQIKKISDFIITPNTLRLQSKKYPGEGAQVQSWLQEKDIDFLVVIAYGNIIPQYILDIPTIGPINVHGSLLPAYRGASPIQSVLLDDQDETGITIMRMDAGLDTGPMLRAQGFPLTIHTTALDIIHKFQEFGPQLLIDTMVDYATGKIVDMPQPEEGVSHCSKLEKTHGLVNPWTQSLHEINNIYRGCYLWPKTYFILDESRGKYAGKQIIIDTLELDDTKREYNKDLPLFATRDSGLVTNDAVITLLIKPEGSKAMKWEDWLRGR